MMTPGEITLASVGLAGLISHYIAQRGFIRDMFQKQIGEIREGLSEVKEDTDKLKIQVAQIKERCRGNHNKGFQEDSDGVLPRRHTKIA